MENLKEIFYNPKTGYISLDKLYQKIKDNKINLTYKQVKDFYESQALTQVMKPIRKSKKFNSIYANYPRNMYQMDIIIYERYTYHIYKYILVVIDIYSRYASARAMTNRRMETIIENFNDIIKEMGKPDKLECDNEFNKKEFIDVLKADNIIPIFSHPDELHKNSIVERFNGTLAMTLQKVRLALKRYDWYKYLGDVLFNYNHTIHSTTKETPASIWDGEESNKQIINFEDNTFKVGDKVRIMRKKKAFQKGDITKYSPDIYLIEKVNMRVNVHLNGLVRSYKPYEIKKVSDIVEKEDLEEPETQTATNKIQQLYKRLDIDPVNIIVGKRNRK